MEYCSEGSLESYLLKHRHSYINLVNKGKLVCDSMLKTRSNEIYVTYVFMYANSNMLSIVEQNFDI